MRQVTITKSSQGLSDWHAIDRRGSSGDDYLLIIEIVGGGNIVDFEFSPERPGSTAADVRDEPSIIIQHNILKDLTESCASTMLVPFQAFRLNVKKYGTGIIKAIVVQGGMHGN